MKTLSIGLLTGVILFACGCATVTVTKTGKGYYPATNPDDVEILMTVPTRPFIELATVTTQNWGTQDTAKMHNSLRAKSSPLGADAVILNSSGIDQNNYFWSSGVAIKYKTQGN
jgi:hypothetical protein